MEKYKAVTNRIHDLYFPTSEVIFLAGSLVRGEGTKFSDLDIVVVFPKVECAYRKSFTFEGYLVEAFIHDIETLKYFITFNDYNHAKPFMANMINEGIEIPGKTSNSEKLKRYSKKVLEAGPPSLSKKELDKRRYAITNLLDDLRDCNKKDELMAIGVNLYDTLANFYFRTHGLWEGEGRSVVRNMKSFDFQFNEVFQSAFHQLFTLGSVNDLIKLSEQILEPHGGLLFNDFVEYADTSWRLKE